MQSSTQYRGVPDKNAKQKEEAVAFYAQHNVTGALETLLNDMFLDNPEDVYGYMSEYFHRLSVKPVISDIKGWYQLDGRGSQSLAVSMQCKINGVNKTVCTYTHPIVEREEEGNEQLMNSPPKGQQLKQKTKKNADVVEKDSKVNEEEETPKQQSPPDALKCLKPFVDKVKGLSPLDQITIDSMITQLSSTLNDTCVSSQSALSCLATVASSTLLETPSSFHLLNTFNKKNDRLSVPIPVMKFITVGQGKLKVRSFYISPSPTADVTEGIKHVISLYKEVGHQLASKQGPIGYATLPDGSYCMACDKIEQVLELLKEAAVHTGLELNRELSLYIDVGADTVYDIDKKKYEIISGQWKTADELIVIYTNLLSSYTGLIGFIDPLHQKDIEGWSSLVDQLGNKCLLISDSTCSELFSVEESQQEEPSDKPAVEDEEKKEKTISFISCSTLSSAGPLISNYFKDAIMLKGHSRYLMFSVNDNQTVDSLKLMVDMAVALNCKFMKLCAPSGLGSMVALSRLVELRAELMARSLHRPSSALLFSCAQQDGSTES